MAPTWKEKYQKHQIFVRCIIFRLHSSLLLTILVLLLLYSSTVRWVLFFFVRWTTQFCALSHEYSSICIFHYIFFISYFSKPLLRQLTRKCIQVFHHVNHFCMLFFCCCCYGAMMMHSIPHRSNEHSFVAYPKHITLEKIATTITVRDNISYFKRMEKTVRSPLALHS